MAVDNSLVFRLSKMACTAASEEQKVGLEEGISKAGGCAEAALKFIFSSLSSLDMLESWWDNTDSPPQFRQNGQKQHRALQCC